MSELELFAACLQIPDGLLRSKYLELACGADATLRQRIETLLHNHQEAGSFLNNPAQLPEAWPAELGSGQPPENQAAAADEDENCVLRFLEPTTKPGALGQLGHYDVLEVIGHGGFGTVVRAFDEKLHRMVAIKIMAPKLALTSPARKRFIREARASAAIRHENVVGIHAIEEQPIPYLVMEYVAGETLQQRLDRTGPLEVPDVLRIGMQVAHGLAAAHVMGSVHRDIKPANILLENDVARVKLTDFGLARAADDASVTQSGIIAGTPMYMAPEQAQSLGVDHRADLFSLGSVLYVMSSGRPPFRAPTTLAVLKRVAEDTPRPIRDIMPEVPERLCNLIQRLHAKNPDDRPQSANEVARVLEQYLSEWHRHGELSQKSALQDQAAEPKTKSAEVTPSPPAIRPTAVRPSSGKNGWLVAAAILVVLLTGLGFAEATGLTQVSGTVVRLFSPDGTLVVEVDDPGVSVTIDGGEIVITGTGAREIRLRPGQYNVQASKDGKIVRQELVTVTKNNRPVVRVSRELAATVAPDRRVPDPHTSELRSPDQRAAAYALSIGGTLIIIEKGKERYLWPGNDVPPEPFDLRVVSLIGNRLARDAGMDQFKECKYLTNLDLERTQITPAKILELKRALPRCRIEWDGDIKLLPDFPDRRAAEYVLSIGGLTQIKGGGLYRSADSRSALPRGAFMLRAVNLMQNQSVDNSDLAVFRGCNRLESLILSGTKVGDTGLVHIKECTALTNLDLGGTNVSDAGLAHFKDHLSLKALTLNDTKITDQGLAHLNHHAGLTQLSLNGMGITDLGLANFKSCRNIATLDLGNTQASDGGLVYFKDCKDLVRISLAGTKVTDTGLAPLKDCKNLVSLDLSKTRLSDAGLSHFKDCASLAVLELEGTQIGDAGLACLKDCKSLNQLNLAHSQVSDAAVSQLLGYSKLVILDVKHTRMTEAGLKQLATGLPACRIECDAGVIEPTANPDPDRRVAEWLRFGASFNVFTDGREIQVYSYLDLPKSPFQLRRLRICGNPKVSDETAPLFRGLRNLTHLDILNCNVSDTFLACCNDSTRLKELALHGTRVTDVGAAQLARFSELQFVNLNQTAVTEEGVKRLAAALPRCRIEWNGGLIEPH